MEDTVFDKILRRELPAEVVYENEKVLAFLDMMPEREGHTLVLPKKRARNIFDVDEDAFLEVMKAAHALAPHICRAVGASGVRIIMNNEPSGGQAVFYLHVHIIPYREDEPANLHGQPKAAQGDITRVGEKIRSTISD